MLNYFLPNEYVKSIFAIHPEMLQERHIQGIITDLDNTLVAWDVADPSPEITEWFKQMNEHHIKVTIISNNNQERVRKFSEPLNTSFLFGAKKPLPHSFKQAANEMNLSRESVVVIGDQVLTDVLGGNLAGFYTILVAPVVQTDGKATKLNRKIERHLLNYMRKKGRISWEE